MYLVKLKTEWQGDIVKDLAAYFFDGSYCDYDVFQVLPDKGIFVLLEDSEVEEAIGEIDSGYDHFTEECHMEAHKEGKA